MGRLRIRFPLAIAAVRRSALVAALLYSSQFRATPALALATPEVRLTCNSTAAGPDENMVIGGIADPMSFDFHIGDTAHCSAFKLAFGPQLFLDVSYGPIRDAANGSLTTLATLTYEFVVNQGVGGIEVPPSVPIQVLSHVRVGAEGEVDQPFGFGAAVSVFSQVHVTGGAAPNAPAVRRSGLIAANYGAQTTETELSFDSGVMHCIEVGFPIVDFDHPDKTGCNFGAIELFSDPGETGRVVLTVGANMATGNQVSSGRASMWADPLIRVDPTPNSARACTTPTTSTSKSRRGSRTRPSCRSPRASGWRSARWDRWPASPVASRAPVAQADVRPVIPRTAPTPPRSSRVPIRQPTMNRRAGFEGTTPFPA